MRARDRAIAGKPVESRWVRMESDVFLQPQSRSYSSEWDAQRSSTNVLLPIGRKQYGNLRLLAKPAGAAALWR
jgi:hypothetical protein